MSTVHVARNGAPLGIFSSEEIKTGLGNGQFVLSDLAWQAGMAQWTLLQEWPEFAPQNDAPPPLTAPIPDAPTALEPAWERRETVGTWKAFWQTVRDVLFSPTKVFSALPTAPSLSKAFVFYVLLVVPFAFLEKLANIPFQDEGGVLGEMSRQNPESYERLMQNISPELLPFLQALGGDNIFVGILVGIIWAILGFFIFGGLTHLTLCLVDGATRSLATTLVTIAYLSGAVLVFAWVPFIGIILACVWGLILQVIALARAHQTSIVKAVIATLLPLLCCCCGICLLVVNLAMLMRVH